MENVSDQIASWLKAQGVRYIFGLPGGENVPLLDAFRRAGLQLILMHHETSAGFAADVFGQFTGRPGVAMATVGPGAINLIAGAASATLERSPMLAITAEVDPLHQHRVTHMQLDLVNLFGQVSKGSFRIQPADALLTLRQAWDLAMTPPFGAAHLAISPEAALSPAASSRGDEFPIKSRDIADEAQISKASSILESAKNVFILVGVGVEIASAQTALLEFAEMWGVPVAVTPKAKGHFPESHPLFAGCFTAYGDQALRDALESADLILGVGLDGVDFVTSFWEIQTPLVNLSPGRALDPVTNPLVAINGNLATLLGEFADLRSNSRHGEKLAQDLRRKIGQALQTNHIRVSGRTRIIPFIQDLRTVVPPDGMVTVDVGVFKLVFLQAWQTDFSKTLFVANGLSAMGYAIPGAIALKLANPQGPVIAIVGDGALHMYTGELATLARLGLPVVVLVIVDKAYALIRLKQHRYEVPVYGTEFQSTDYAALAKAYGLDYRLIDGEDHTKTILHEALKTNGPILVEVRIDVTEYDHYK